MEEVGLYNRIKIDALYDRFFSLVEMGKLPPEFGEWEAVLTEEVRSHLDHHWCVGKKKRKQNALRKTSYYKWKPTNRTFWSLDDAATFLTELSIGSWLDRFVQLADIRVDLD